MAQRGRCELPGQGRAPAAAEDRVLSHRRAGIARRQPDTALLFAHVAPGTRTDPGRPGGRLVAQRRPPAATAAYITRSLPPSTGICAPVVFANAAPHSSAASSATSRLVTSTRSTLFFRYCSTLIP